MCTWAVLESEKYYMEAAKKNDVDTMKLLGKSVNVNAKNVVSFPHRSEKYSVSESNKGIHSGGARTVKDCMLPQHDRTALHYAVAGKNQEAVQLLLQRRAKLDVQDKVRPMLVSVE